MMRDLMQIQNCKFYTPTYLTLYVSNIFYRHNFKKKSTNHISGKYHVISLSYPMYFLRGKRESRGKLVKEITLNNIPQYLWSVQYPLKMNKMELFGQIQQQILHASTCLIFLIRFTYFSSSHKDFDSSSFIDAFTVHSLTLRYSYPIIFRNNHHDNHCRFGANVLRCPVVQSCII